MKPAAGDDHPSVDVSATTFDFLVFARRRAGRLKRAPGAGYTRRTSSDHGRENRKNAVCAVPSFSVIENSRQVPLQFRSVFHR